MVERRKRKPQRRSRGLNVIISKIERAVQEAGYVPSAIVPLLNEVSVVGEKDGVTFNIRLDKKTFKVTSVEKLSYSYNREKKIKSIFRTKT